MSRRIGLTLAFALGLLAVLIWLRPGMRAQTARVDRGPVGDRIVARAAVVPGDDLVHLYAAKDGRLLRVLAREGDRVEAGAVLVELEVAGLRESITSPVRGAVLERRAEVGDHALAAEHGAPQPLFVLADPARTELRIEVEERDAARLEPGQAVHIMPMGAPGASAHGRVERVAAQLVARSIGVDDARVRAGGMVRAAAVAFSGPRPDWPIGARAEAVIELRRRDAAARVPRSALSVRDGRAVVQTPFALWTRDVPVEILSVDDAYAEILGLAVGTEVVVASRP